MCGQPVGMPESARRYFIQRDTEGVGRPFAIGRIDLQAVADIADPDLARRSAEKKLDTSFVLL